MNETITIYIKSRNTEISLCAKFDEYIPEYVDEGWEDEHDDVYEAYSECGRGEAEEQVIQEIYDDMLVRFELEPTDELYNSVRKLVCEICPALDV